MVSEMSFESQQTRVFLQQYLNNLLLTSKNIYVKIKVVHSFKDYTSHKLIWQVLKLIKAVLDEGHGDFHRNFQRDSGVIQQQTGSLLHSLVPYIMSVLFSTSPQTKRQCTGWWLWAHQGLSECKTNNWTLLDFLFCFCEYRKCWISCMRSLRTGNRLPPTLPLCQCHSLFLVSSAM